MDIKLIYKTIQKLVIVYTLVPLVIAYTKQLYKQEQLKYIFYLLLFYFISDISLLIAAKVFHNNMFLMRSITIIAHSIIIVFYWQILNKKWHRIVLMLGILFFVVMECLDIYWNGYDSFDSIASDTSAFVIMLLGFIFFFKQIGSKELISIFQNTFFWVNIGILFYYGVTFNLFLFTNKYIKEFFSGRINLWAINVFGLYCFYTLLCIAFYKYKQEPKP
jgi:hypothetical protein